MDAITIVAHSLGLDVLVEGVKQMNNSIFVRK